MATSEAPGDRVVQRGRSRSDPSIITDTRVAYTNSTGEDIYAYLCVCVYLFTAYI